MEGTAVTVSKPVQKSDWKDGFLFLGNHLALDFLNTCPVQNGETVELLPDFDALLRWFRAADVLSSREVASLRQLWGESARAQHVVEAVRELRERLRKGGPRQGTRRHSSSRGPRRTESLNGRASHAHQAEDEWQRVNNGVVVRSAPARRLVCSSGAQCGHVVRCRGSQPCPQMWTVRAALL